MALEPIEIDRDGQKSMTDLDAVTDTVIANKALEYDRQVVGAQLAIAANEFLQGVRVADGKEIDEKVDVETTTAVAQRDEARTRRDARLEKVKGDLSKQIDGARRGHLEGLMQAWEQDYAGHRAHILLDEDPEQVKASEVAMLVIEAAHTVAKAELDDPGQLEKTADVAAEVSVARVEAVTRDEVSR